MFEKFEHVLVWFVTNTLTTMSCSLSSANGVQLYLRTSVIKRQCRCSYCTVKFNRYHTACTLVTFLNPMRAIARSRSREATSVSCLKLCVCHLPSQGSRPLPVKICLCAIFHPSEDNLRVFWQPHIQAVKTDGRTQSGDILRQQWTVN